MIKFNVGTKIVADHGYDDVTYSEFGSDIAARDYYLAQRAQGVDGIAAVQNVEPSGFKYSEYVHPGVTALVVWQEIADEQLTV